MTLPSFPTIQTRDLGRLAYAPAFELQRELNQAVIDGRHPPTILLVEHDPVITLTRRKSVRDHLLADEQQLARLGVATEETDRGGDITYHGPGQLVVYPILKLGDLGLNLSSYMRLLEQAVIDTAAKWNITAHRECGATGVWVDSPRLAGDTERPVPNPETPTAKLCAMGVRIRKNTTMHGLALNVDPDLAHFDLIVPCGLAGRPVTSMKQLRGGDCPTMQQVKDALLQSLTSLLQEGAGGRGACRAANLR
jgi:lipoate-protein ligase B